MTQSSTYTIQLEAEATPETNDELVVRNATVSFVESFVGEHPTAETLAWMQEHYGTNSIVGTFHFTDDGTMVADFHGETSQDEHLDTIILHVSEILDSLKQQSKRQREREVEEGHTYTFYYCTGTGTTHERLHGTGIPSYCLTCTPSNCICIISAMKDVGLS